MLLRVGQSSWKGDMARYATRFDLSEVRAEPGHVPRAATLHQWREQAPRDHVFSVVLGGAVGRLTMGPELDGAMDAGLKAARALHAQWIVLQTGPTVTPSKRNQRRLEEVVRRLPREGWRVAWEPRGLWEPEQEEEISEALEMTLVRDFRRHERPAGEVAYTRLLALGTGARFGAESAEVVAERAAGLQQLYVVVEGQGARGGIEALRQLLADGYADANLPNGES